tara:strand:- start:195 stop:827 length:633 start_codon:yes stop_codon:yes gene_type:complete
MEITIDTKEDLNMTDRYYEEIELAGQDGNYWFSDIGTTIEARVFKQNWFLMEYSNRGRNELRIADAEAHCAKREAVRQLETGRHSAVPITLGGCIIEEPLDMGTHKGEDLAQHILDSGMQEWFDELVKYVDDCEDRDRGVFKRHPTNEMPHEEVVGVWEHWGINIYVTGLGPVNWTLVKLLTDFGEKLHINVTIWQWCNDTGYWPTQLEV